MKHSNNLYETHNDSETVKAIKKVVLKLTNKNTAMEETLNEAMSKNVI